MKGGLGGEPGLHGDSGTAGAVVSNTGSRLAGLVRFLSGCLRRGCSGSEGAIRMYLGARRF